MTAHISSSSDNISSKVMARLDELYKEPIKDEKLKNFPQTKLIAVLSDNDGHRRSLESLLGYFSYSKFVKQVHYIIDSEVAKSAWTAWDYVNVFFIKPGEILGASYSFYKAGPILYQAGSEKIGEWSKLLSSLWNKSK